jgi:Holliday junction resolvase RusA-like endonuclease
MSVPLASDQDYAFDLPYPPSVNRIWRSSTKSAGKNVYIAPSYVKWKQAAGALLMTQRGWMMRRVVGPFSIDIALCPPKGHPRGDLDNRIKAVLDFLQASTVISNDKHCQLICAYWALPGMAPEGCRATVKPWQPQPAPSVNDVLRASVARLEGIPT